MDSFRREIARLVQQQNAVERLSDERMQTLEDSVYAHIDRLFPNEVTEEHTVSKRESRINEWLSIMWKPRTLAAAALLTVVFVALLISKPHPSDFLLELPASVAQHHYDAYIDTQAPVSRALIATNPTPRRQAFIAGVIRADLDLSADFTEAWREHINSRITDYAQNDDTRYWLEQGYAVEVLYLAARRSMPDLDVRLVGDALDFYRQESARSQVFNDDVNVRFIENHQRLINTADLQTPARRNCSRSSNSHIK